MTYKEAFRANLRPYQLPSDSIEFLLTQQGLEMDDEYEVSEDNNSMLFAAVVDGLYQVISLEQEKDTGSTQIYDTTAIAKRIKMLCNRYGITDPNKEVEQFTDRTSEW